MFTVKGFRREKTEFRLQITEVRKLTTEIANSFTFSMRYALCSMPFIARSPQPATRNP